MRIAPSLQLTAPERQQLTQWARGAAGPPRGSCSAPRLPCWRPRATIISTLLPPWTRVGTRWARGGRPPKARQTLVARILKTTTQTTPPGATHWSTRTLARHLRTNATFVQRVWTAHGLQPHRVRAFKLSQDPHFQDKLEDVVGLYLHPPEHAVVLSVDEKSQIQALDRTQPGLPMKKGRCGTMTHDYKRHGTTTLFAALNVAEGSILSTCLPRHRHQEWLMFLRLRLIDRQIPQGKTLHLIADNYATHKHPAVQRWLTRHPRVHMHFTPTSSSWLNLVERVFGDLTAKQIRRGVFRSVPELIAAIDAYMTQRNAQPTPFVWTKTAQEILVKVNRGRIALDKIRTA